MVRRSDPYSLIADVNAFCWRLEEHSLLTTRAAVAWPYFTYAATRSKSSQVAAISSVFARRVSNGPTCG